MLSKTDVHYNIYFKKFDLNKQIDKNNKQKYNEE